jgi:hypothetical protein
MKAAQERHQLVADQPASGGRIRGVGAELQPLGAAVGLGLLAPERQQRPDDPVLASGLDPDRVPAGDEAVEDGLDLVGGGVAGGAQAVGQ